MMKMRNVWVAVLCFVLVTSILVKADCEKITITGVINDIDSGALQITLDDGTVVDAADAVITLTTKKVQEVIDFSDLAVGMTVSVCGTMDLIENVLVADKINVKYCGE